MHVLFVAVLLLYSTIDPCLGGCNGSLTLLTESQGQITRQPGDQARMCIWKISVLSYLRIVFYFKRYNLDNNLHSYPNHNGDCNEKNTRIELKNSQTEQPWKSYCQSGMPEPIATKQSTLYVKFIASDNDLQSEFSAQYYTLPFKQTIDLKKASNAIISSPEFPGKYPRNSYFTWSVVAPSGFRIKIEFLKLNIFLTSDCSQDALVVRDGPSVKSKVLKRICGHRHPGNSNVLYSSSNTMTLEFVSALFGSHDSFGFEARVSKEVKLYIIVVPCAIGILVVSLIVAAVVFMFRRLSASGGGHPRMQMSLLNEADHFSTTQISEADTANEANLPVYRPTTQQIAKT
ncbi:Tolloid-like protein 2 [Acropora cervicornis]|uniref:Tolloid-like protein 2 n=1 Tax=Acropora cervicornis TaxID=6130 RepID=A0AAD9PZT0_ACRCE|nr:Tolloid-like protein 2 [Acropora cervicornis]